MKIKRAAYGTNALVLTVLLAGILTIVNIYASRHFCRVDLTQNRQYTISDSTRRILGNLDDIVNIRVYLSKKLPPYMVSITDQVTDLLEEYRIYADGMLAIEYIDPADDPALQRKLQFMGIPQLQLNIIERDQAAVTNVYMGLAVLYGDKKEVIPALTEVERFEYDLTGKILRVTRGTDQTVGFLSGHGEPDLQKGLRSINQLLKDQYYTRTVPTASGDPIAAQVSALVVAAPQELSERDLFEIDQYIMHGGRVIFLVNGVAVNERMEAQAQPSPLGGLLAHYGVKVLPQLVLDQINANASFQSGMFSIMLPYPFWVRVVREMSESTHPISSSIESMVLPWASPLAVVDNATADKRVSVIAQSSEVSWVQQGYFDLNPNQEFYARPDELARRPLAVALSGRFTSYFSGRPVPPVAAHADEQTAGAAAARPDGREVVTESPATRIVVVGNSKFITENFPLEFEGNRTFFLNAIDWLTIGDELIGIRSREAGERPLKLLSEQDKLLVRLGNMLAVPLLVVLYGFLHYWLRRRRRRLDALELQKQ